MENADQAMSAKMASFLGIRKRFVECITDIRNGDKGYVNLALVHCLVPVIEDGVDWLEMQIDGRPVGWIKAEDFLAQ